MDGAMSRSQGNNLFPAFFGLFYYSCVSLFSYWMRIYRSGLTFVINKNFEVNEGNMGKGFGFLKKKRHFINPRQLQPLGLKIPTGSSTLAMRTCASAQ